MMGLKKICIMLYDENCLHIMQSLNSGGVWPLSYIKTLGRYSPALLENPAFALLYTRKDILESEAVPICNYSDWLEQRI